MFESRFRQNKSIKFYLGFIVIREKVSIDYSCRQVVSSVKQIVGKDRVKQISVMSDDAQTGFAFFLFDQIKWKSNLN